MASADDVLSDRASRHRLSIEVPRLRINRPEVIPARRLPTIPILESNITIVALRSQRMDVGWLDGMISLARALEHLSW